MLLFAALVLAVTVGGIALAVAATLGRRWIERHSPTPHEQHLRCCGACGYPARGWSGPCCPECGADRRESPLRVRTVRSGPMMNLGDLLRIVCTAGLLGLLVLGLWLLSG